MDDIGSFFFEITGCDGEDVIIIYLKLDVANNTAPILEDWEGLDITELEFEVLSNETYSQDLSL
jgi:hypothetical protein